RAARRLLGDFEGQRRVGFGLGGACCQEARRTEPDETPEGRRRAHGAHYSLASGLLTRRSTPAARAGSARAEASSGQRRPRARSPLYGRGPRRIGGSSLVG